MCKRRVVLAHAPVSLDISGTTCRQQYARHHILRRVGRINKRMRLVARDINIAFNVFGYANRYETDGQEENQERRTRGATAELRTASGGTVTREEPGIRLRPGGSAARRVMIC